jgi:hypothetical protein
MWSNQQQQSYGGQSVNIKNRWSGHWQGSGGGRFHRDREGSAGDGRAGVMMRVEEGVERSIAESILNLALGLNSEMSRQKVSIKLCTQPSGFALSWSTWPSDWRQL